MDSSENDEAQETPTSPSDAPQAEPQIDLADEEGFPRDVSPEPLSDVDEAGAPGMPDEDAYDQSLPPDRPTLEGGIGEAETWTSSEPPMAEPGIYVCIYENAGEHPVLGRLDHGTEYDYSQVHDEPTLIAIAACVKRGLLEKM